MCELLPPVFLFFNLGISYNNLLDSIDAQVSADKYVSTEYYTLSMREASSLLPAYSKSWPHLAIVIVFRSSHRVNKINADAFSRYSPFLEPQRLKCHAHFSALPAFCEGINIEVFRFESHINKFCPPQELDA